MIQQPVQAFTLSLLLLSVSSVGAGGHFDVLHGRMKWKDTP